ncbi:carboxymuconolactone decarboxylase family protein [Staphylococcus capitis]|uniref:carboxymuconolactone decarboxylase family protein n=1 Tax=Staphylococcus capitis TaxID=29388 RepID=UPI000F5C3631|nr:carboxymuconolactone decarboxylase family protein [Staphylococcus capitis]RQX47411.1 carboxymuconolactone decarboxylase family protein [Staphylococcus capitis]
MVIMNFSKNGKTPFQKLLGHNKAISKSWNNLANVLENDGALSKELKEELRRILAQENGCLYCKAKGLPTKNFQDEKSLLCIGFVEVFLKTKKNVPESTIALLKDSLTETEIIELITFTLFTTTQQYFGSILKLSYED